jgi:hypothetical protein
MSRRNVAIGLAIASTAAVTAAAVTLALTTVAERDRTTATASPITADDGAAALASVGVRPPAKGAYLGAWVKPALFSDAGRVAAVDALAGDIGRRLDVVQNYHRWTDDFPTDFDRSIAHSGAIPLISWAGTDTRLIALGDDDEVIRQRARALKAWRAPMMLRWRWEMDRDNLQNEIHGPKDYIAAWKRIRSVFAAEGAGNVSFVWCPLAEGFGTGEAQKFYPGDDEVDWVCADAYTLDPRTPLETVLAPFLRWAAPTGKPIVVAEFGTVPGRSGERARWLAGVPPLVAKYPQVKAMLYFDSDTEQRGEDRRWSLRWDHRDINAFAQLARNPALNPRRLPVKTQ